MISTPRAATPLAMETGIMPPLLELQNITFGYEPDRPVLDGFDLTIESGQSVALVGATGAGKTTVANLVPRFYDTDDGAILLDGVDIREVRPQDLRRFPTPESPQI